MDSDNANAIDAVSNGFSSEEPQILTLDDQEHHQSEVSDDSAIKILHHEIQELRRDRSDLQRRMEEMLSEMEKSEVGTKALAAHASYVEGQLLRTQQHLESAETQAGNMRSAVEILKNEKEAMEEKNADLEVERGKKDGEIRVLKAAARVSEEQIAIKDRDLFESRLKIADIQAYSREAIGEEVKNRIMGEEKLERVIEVLKERNSELEKGLVNQESKRVEELEQTVKELKERISELEANIDEILSKDNGLNDEKSREMEMLTAASAAKVSWAMAAAAAASAGTVAAAVTVFYLRHGRQR